MKIDKTTWAAVRRNYLFRTAVLCLVISLITFGYFQLRYGAFTLRDDWNRQSLTFMRAIQKGILAILTGKGGEWTWNLDLGSPFIYGFSFYNLGSPFTLLTLPLLGTGIPYPVYVGALYVLKFMVAGVLAAKYLRPFVKTDRGAEMGAILYAFSGYTCVNLIFQFIDSVALFPLMLIGMERVLESPGTDGRLGKNRVWERVPRFVDSYGLFVFAVFLNGMTDYYMLIQETLFVILYFLFRMAGKKGFTQKFAGFAISGIWGGLMAACLILPSIHALRGSNRSAATMLQWKYVLGDPVEALFVLRNMVLPADTMADTSMFVPFDYTSTGLWLPMVGLSLVIAYVWKKRDWISGLIVILTLLSFSPTLSAGFGLFSSDYKRWWFMLALLMAMASVRVLEDPENYPVSSGIEGNLGLIAVVLLGAFLLRDEENRVLVNDLSRVLFYVACAVLGLIVTSLLGSKRAGGSKEHRSKKQLLYIGFFAATALLSTAVFYHTEDTAAYLRNYRLGMTLETPDPQYRYRLNDNDLTLTGDAAGTSSFNSTTANSIREFELLFDFDRASVSMDMTKYNGLSELVAGRYQLTIPEGNESETGGAGDVDDLSYGISDRNVCPIGFPVYAYVTAEDLRYNVKAENRAMVLMYAAAIPKERETEITTVSPKTPKILGSEVNFEAMDAYIEMAQVNSVQNFTRIPDGFTCTTGYGEDQLVYFTVPFDEGWSAVIDETPINIIDSCGMMLLNVPAGMHQITFEYHTPMFQEGIIISVVTALAFVVIFTGNLIIRRREAK